MDNVFTFPGAKAKVSDEEITQELLTVLEEMRKVVENEDAESILVVGFTRKDVVYGAFGGLMNPIAMAGLLERVKLQLLTT